MQHTRHIRRIGLLAIVAASLLTPLACEHYRYWRGSTPWPTSLVKQVATPEGEQAALKDLNMAPIAGSDEVYGDKTGIEKQLAVLQRSKGCISCHGLTDSVNMHDVIDADDERIPEAMRKLAASNEPNLVDQFEAMHRQAEQNPDAPGNEDVAFGLRRLMGTMFKSATIACVDCHGGDGAVMTTLATTGRPSGEGATIHDAAYLHAMQAAHVKPRHPDAWYGREHLQDGRPYGEHPHHDPAHLHGSRTPQNTYALLNHESPTFIRFVNPGDLRIADYACGACHERHVAFVPHSMMNHGSMLWAAALYNNGSIPNKHARYGESYSAFGLPQRLQGVIALDEAGKPAWRGAYRDEVVRKGVLQYLDPLPVWNVSQPGNILRVFERGTKLPVPGGAVPNPSPAEIGNPNPLVEGGRPDKGLSPRGLGTLNRTDPVFLGLQKTRLLDPLLSFMGTNDHPGDYRASGCTACHTPYANDRDPMHGYQFAALDGHHGRSKSIDPTLPKDEPGHPIRHVLTNAVPTSQCIVCHIHPGTSYANTYLGYMWWDNESDGEHMYPNRSRNPTPEQEWRALRKNPEGSQLKGLWGNLYPDAVSHAGDKAGDGFLEKTGTAEFNAKLKHNQFADFHGHGWMFRAVFKKDRQGHLLDEAGERIADDDPHRLKKAVHLQDVHLQKHGMSCVDCHFSQDMHGDGKLYGEVRNAIEITCVDCHGTYDKATTLRTSGPAAPPGGRDMTAFKVRGRARFERDAATGQVYQYKTFLKGDETTDEQKRWIVTQTIDTIDPDSAWSKDHPQSAKASRYAKTVRVDGSWGDVPNADDPHKDLPLAHPVSTMACYTCHTSWMTSCFGCHLPMRANQRTPILHNEGLYTRNWTQYNYQVLRDDVFMLGRDAVVTTGEIGGDGSTVKPGRIVPVRSSSAVVVSSQNANREWIYHQQQTVSGEGYSGQAFNPHFPHAVSGAGTTKQCTDCHVSRDNDNNAWMAQLLLQGTNFVNFFGRYIYVATGREGLTAVAATEHDEPQAVYGSHLHALAYPDEYRRFVEAERRELRESHHHDAGWGNEILDLQLRGEYLYAARGSGGFYVYDVANIDNKGFSERIITAPVSPLGQDLGFRTRYAVAIASPATIAVDPARSRYSADPSKPAATLLDDPQPWHTNREQKVHPMYAYLYIADRYEGLIMTFAATLLDGDPDNNFMQRATLADGSTAYNPGGLLDGMTHLTLAGHYVYATCKAGLVIIDIDNPLDPRHVATIGSDVLRDPRSVAVQFRYAFVTDADGLKVIDITDLTSPRAVEGAQVKLDDAQRVYIARTYAFVAAGKQGVAIIDVTNPEKPALQTLFDDEGRLNDARDVKVGMTNASLFAYVADGRNGLKVLSLMGPDTTPRFRGFSPPLTPHVIARHHTHGPALAVSKALDRDRAVDETGHQVAVFGRIGARPLNLEEMRRLYLRDGKLFTVTNEAETEPNPFTLKRTDRPAATPNRPGPPRPGPARPGPARPGPARPGPNP